MKLSLLLSLFASIVYADLIPISVLSTGDSVSTAYQTRYGFQVDLEHGGFAPTFLGDTEQTWSGLEFDYQGHGGFGFAEMLVGTVEQDGMADALTRYNPDVITILGGYQEVAGESTMTQIEADLDALLDYSFANSSAIILVANVTTFRRDWAHKQPRVLEWNSTLLDNINARRAAGQQIGYVDNFAKVSSDMIDRDGLHLNAMGSIRAGRGWFPVWQPMSVPEPSAFVLLAVLCGLLVVRSRI